MYVYCDMTYKIMNIHIQKLHGYSYYHIEYLYHKKSYELEAPGNIYESSESYRTIPHNTVFLLNIINFGKGY